MSSPPDVGADALRRVHDPGHVLTGIVASAAAFALGLGIDLLPTVPLGYLVALAALPVTLGVVRQFRGAQVIVGLAVVATVSGFLIAWITLPPDADLFRTTAIGQGARVLMIGLGALLLLWARTVIGSSRMVLAFALGTLATVAVDGISPINPWKFSFSLPLTILLLSLPLVYRRLWTETALLFALALFSATQDSRSAAATMLIAGALVLTRSRRSSRRGRAWAVLLRFGLLGLGGFFLIQAALLNGDLGAEARQRTMEQIETSGSVLLGGRPEIGASFALLTDRPWGYGIGVQPSPTQIGVAKSGMAELGYDPNNGYVESYMFGDGIEVHSVFVDLWLLAGLPGLALGLAVGGYVVWGMAHQLSQRVASGVLIYLTVRVLWDLAFGPFLASMPALMLCIALALPWVRLPSKSELGPRSHQ